MNKFVEEQDIKEVYREDTQGRKYHTPITTKHNPPLKNEASEVASINLNAPMTWQEFKKLPDTLKVKYLEHLRDCYEVSITLIANMFGLTQPGLQGVINKLGLKGTFPKSRRNLPSNVLDRWNTFLNSGEKTDSDVSVVETEVATESMKFTGCTFSFGGKFNVKDIVKKLSACIDEGTECRIRISMWGNEDDATN